MGLRRTPRDPEGTRAARNAVEQARQEYVQAVSVAAQAEKVSRWHINIRQRNNIGPAMAAEYGRFR